MRYAKDESTYILGIFNSGDTVNITVYRLSDDTKVVDGASCSEIGSTGIFKYPFSQTVTQKEEYLWIMTNGSYSKYGKIILGGWMDDINNNITNHRNTVEPKIDTTISSRLASNDSRLDNLDATISSRASQDSVNAIPTNPLLDDDSRLDNLDAKISSRSSHTPSDVWNYSTRELSNPDNYKADVSSLALESTVQNIKAQTDKLQFNTYNDVKATLDGEKVVLTDTTESQIDNIENNVTNPDQYKADVSSLAKEATLQSHRNAIEPNIDDKISNIPSNVDTQLSSSHGSGSWEGTNPADVWSYTTRTLTSLSGQPAQDIDDKLSVIHGSGSWEGASASEVADAVWDENRNEHTASDTYGKVDEWAGQVDTEKIASAVWESKLQNYNSPNTMGYKLNHISGASTTKIINKGVWTKKEKESILQIINEISKQVKNLYSQLNITENVESLLTKFNQLESKLVASQKLSKTNYNKIEKLIHSIKANLQTLSDETKTDKLQPVNLKIDEIIHNIEVLTKLFVSSLDNQQLEKLMEHEKN